MRLLQRTTRRISLDCPVYTYGRDLGKRRLRAGRGRRRARSRERARAHEQRHRREGGGASRTIIVSSVFD
ncbi:MAG TPA: hypothetical protein VF322_05060 [Gammaproteobacteria bacterium]